MTEPWKPEREWTRAEVRDVIRDRWTDIACESVTPFGSGWDNAAFLVDGQFIFRFSKRQIAVPLLLQEWNVLPLLAPKMSIPIPHPKWFGHVEGWSFMGYPHLKGHPASDQIVGHELRHRLAAPLGRFLRVLHEQRPGDHQVAIDSLGRFNIPARHARAVEMLNECGADVDATSLRRILDDVDPTSGDVVLCHGDLYARHLLVDVEQLSGVIDWGDVCLSDRAHDLMLPFCFLPSKARDAFFEEYGPISSSTEKRSRFRAVCHTLHVHHYARSIGDASLLAEAMTSFRFAVE